MRVRSLPDVKLRRVPFTVAEARQAGMRWRDLQTRRWTRTSRGQYAWTGLPQDAMLKLVAVSRRMPARYAFSGLTAAWLLGLDVSWAEPIEVTVPRDAPVRARAGVKLRRVALPESDVISQRGLCTTSAMRTVCDLGSRTDVVESVVVVDMALHAGLVKRPDLLAHVATHAGAKGIKRLRRAVRLAEPRSESAMETRLRIALIRGRLPAPLVQSDLCDSKGRFIGRVDLYYPDRRLASSTTARTTRTVSMPTCADRTPFSVPAITFYDSRPPTYANPSQSRPRFVRPVPRSRVTPLVRTNTRRTRTQRVDSPDYRGGRPAHVRLNCVVPRPRTSPSWREPRRQGRAGPNPPPRPRSRSRWLQGRRCRRSTRRERASPSRVSHPASAGPARRCPTERSAPAPGRPRCRQRARSRLSRRRAARRWRSPRPRSRSSTLAPWPGPASTGAGPRRSPGKTPT